MKYRYKWVCMQWQRRLHVRRRSRVRILPARSAWKMMRLVQNDRAVARQWGLPRIKIIFFAVFKISFFVFIKNYLPCVLWNTTKSLSCVRETTHNKEALCQCLYAVSALPCVTHGKGFTVWISAFAVCLWHTAIHAIPVVHVTLAPALLCADAGGDAVLLSTIWSD